MKTLGKVLIAIAGIIFIILGIVALANPLETLVTVAWLWALSFLVVGIVSLITFFTRKESGRGYLLLLAIISIILGLILLTNGDLFTVATALIMLRIWIIFTGISNIVGCVEEKDAGVSNWWISMILGILLLLIGLFSDGVIFSTALVTVFVGIGLMIVGVSFISKAFAKD